MLNNQIDCLLIGPNEMKLSKQEKLIKTYGINSVAYRDLSLRLLYVDNNLYQFIDLLDLTDGKKNNGNFGSLNLEAIHSGAILYLGSFLNKHSLTFDYIKSFNFQKEELAQKLTEKNILTVAITTTTYLNPFPVKEIISFIKKHNNKIKIIVGGPFVWTQINIQKPETVDSIFKSLGADFYVHSAEGEMALVNIIKQIKGNKNYNELNNVYYKNDNNYLRTEIKSEDNDLQGNLVNWKLFADDLEKLAWVRTSKSCAFKCSFCDSHIRLGKFKNSAADYVEKELDAIKETGKIESIRFVDDTFNIPKKRFKEILKMMVKNEYNFKWSSFFRCQFADEEIIELMVESGCEAVHLGIESANPQILINMNKRSTIEEYERGLRLLNKYNIISFASFIIGFPGETEETIKDTIYFIENSRPTFYLLWPWFCIPSTPIWDEKEKYNIVNTGFDWEHSTMKACEAMDHVENIIINVKNSVYCSFFAEYISVFTSRFGFEKFMNFSKLFDRCIKEKLLDPDKKELDEDKLALFKACLNN